METTILILVCAATVITTIVNFAKPSYEKLVAKKYEATISIGLSFLLGIIAAFSLKSFLFIELNAGALFLIGLALGTGATIFYDVLKLIQKAGQSKLGE